jgi:hypothetical protein
MIPIVGSSFPFSGRRVRARRPGDCLVWMRAGLGSSPDRARAPRSGSPPSCSSDDLLSLGQGSCKCSMDAFAELRRRLPAAFD